MPETAELLGEQIEWLNWLNWLNSYAFKEKLNLGV